MRNKILLIFLLILLILPLASAITGKISPARVILSGNVGDVFEKQITVFNEVNVYPVSIKLISSNNNIVISNDSFILNPGEEKTVMYNVRINEVGVVEENISVRFEAVGETPLTLISSISITGKAVENKKDIAYILKDATKPNQQFISAINELGYSYDLIDDSQIKTTNFSKYKMILIPNEKFSSYINDIPVNQMNSLIANKYHLQDWHWISDGVSQIASSQPLKASVVKVNEITKDIPSNFKVYTLARYDGGSIPMYYMSKYKKALKIKSIVSTYSSKLGSVIASAEKGTVLKDNYISNARGVFFGITESAYWTNESKQLFKNSIKWLIEGENQPPIFSGPIPAQIWNENENLTLNLSRYFSDPENQTLTYSVYNTSQDVNIFVRVVGPIVYFNSTLNWFGTDWIIFKARDPQGLSALSNNISLIVLEKNISIPELKINEFESNPTGDDSGNEWIELYNPNNESVNISGWKIYDGLTTPSLIYTIPASITINSKGFYVVQLTSTKLNNDNEFIILKDSFDRQIDQTPTKADEANDDRTWQRVPNGIDTNSDGDWIFKPATKGVNNDLVIDIIPPIVELISPLNNSLFENTRDVSFNFSASDNLASSLHCELYLNNNVKGVKNIGNGSTGDFFLNNLLDNNYSWNVKCSDGVNTAFAPANWSFSINAPNAPIFNQIGSKTVNENQTLQFTVSATDPDGDEINYSASNLPSGAIFNFSSRIFLWTPDFTQAGNYLVVFTATDSTNLSTSMTVNINVLNVVLPPSFEDADTCSVIDNNVVVTIDKPDDGDDFEIGDDIKIKTEIENNGVEDAKLKVKAYLYDLDKDEVVEEESDSVKVKNGDSEKVEFTINIPDDADTENNFAIYVIASKEKDEFCNSNFIEINIDKPDEKAVIKNFEISPEEVRGNEKVSFEVEVENIGNDDLKDIYVEIKNSELGLNIKSDKFDLDADDKETVNLYFIIPKDTSEKTYEIEAGVVYDSESDKETKELVVIKEIKETPVKTIPITSVSGTGIVSTTGNIIYLSNKEPISLTKKSKTLNIISKDISVKEEIPEIKVTLSVDEEKTIEKKVKTTGTFSEGIGFLIFGFFGINTFLIFGIAIVLILIILILIIRR